MKLNQIFEAAVHPKYLKWQEDCRKANANCHFVGSHHELAQAVIKNATNNPVIGKWDGKLKIGNITPVPDLDDAE
jgi:hypothetical protein